MVTVRSGIFFYIAQCVSNQVEYTAKVHYLLREGWPGAMAENAPSVAAQVLARQFHAAREP